MSEHVETPFTNSERGELSEKVRETNGSSEEVVANVPMSRVSKKNGLKKKKKDRCYYEKCGSTALKFIGDCQFCQGHFCSRHRIMENHSCQGLKSCKEQMHQRNADKLAAEQTIVSKIQI
ncbi:LAME_0D01728g1_1 [Lachancea meyersii CBS 8951]|uniref:LAME_0D01728g1_1 n=1 Tax=Lachancea meyersii CBS 8951 TaxID=1266667 RepID=A0A1G4J6Q7_9SACH|nr:LAME_0D01728g1_1 [Lachancea meyersii CBS 8951]